MERTATTFVLPEYSRARLAWDVAAMCAIVASCFAIPLRTVFAIDVLPGGATVLYLADAILWIDMALNFLTTYRAQGEEVSAPGSTAMHYARTMLPVDVIANLPVIYAAGTVGAGVIAILPAFRLLRLVRLLYVVHRWERQSWTRAGWLRLGKVLLTLVAITHWMASAWFASALLPDFPADSWVVLHGLAHASPIDRYVQSLYWAVITMTTVGYGDITPHRTVEYVLATGIAVIGATAYAFTIGSVTTLLTSLNATRAAFWNRIDTVSHYLHERHLPGDINMRIRDYYEYVWEHYKGAREHTMLEDLPVKFRLDILEHLARDVVARAPVFIHCTQALRAELLLALRPRTYPPECPILSEDEPGHEMCFLIEGRARIVTARDDMVHGTLESGDYFGDLSMILRERRTASVVTETWCDVFVLAQSDFDRIKDEYPEFTDVLARTANERADKVAALLMDGIVL